MSSTRAKGLIQHKNVNILWTKKGNIKKYTTFCGGINEDGEGKSKQNN
jgi:hypothetical protein